MLTFDQIWYLVMIPSPVSPTLAPTFRNFQPQKAISGVPQVFFVLLDQVDLLDLAGPVEVFNSARPFGVQYSLRYCGETERCLRSSSGLTLCDLEPLRSVRPSSGDIVFVPGPVGRDLKNLTSASLKSWLARAYGCGATICSSSTGAFTLAAAGLLDGRHSTTHWTRLPDLRKAAPKSIVEDAALFVQDGNIFTGGGVISSVDLALFILETQHGPLLATKVAQDLIVHLRRSGEQSQSSVYLSYRDHFRAGVHRVQDWIIQNPFRRATVSQLAEIAGISPRHLSRVFKAATGVTIGRYRTLLRLARSKTLSSNPELTQNAIAEECGYQDGRQLRRIHRASRYLVSGVA